MDALPQLDQVCSKRFVDQKQMTIVIWVNFIQDNK